MLISMCAKVRRWEAFAIGWKENTDVNLEGIFLGKK
jgi:hypothetical protein